MPDPTPPAVLTVAGSDPSGGAGIQADLRVFSHLGLHGLSAITAITAQNTTGVQAVYPLPRRQLAAQLESIAGDFSPVAAKTGMLPTIDIIDEVYHQKRGGRLGMLVIDPVLASTGGVDLSDRECAAYLVKRLMPLCRLITPNLIEAAILSGRVVAGADDAKEAARALVDAGAGAACVTGGHWQGLPVDYLFDGEQMHVFEGRRIGSEPVHGTGCIFSAAAAGYLALGYELKDVVERAKLLVERSIDAAFTPGAGMKLPSLFSADLS